MRHDKTDRAFCRRSYVLRRGRDCLLLNWLRRYPCPSRTTSRMRKRSRKRSRVVSSIRTRPARPARIIQSATHAIKRVAAEASKHQPRFGGVFLWYKSGVKEADIQRSILDYLALRRHFHFRCNTGAYKTQHGRQLHSLRHARRARHRRHDRHRGEAARR